MTAPAPHQARPDGDGDVTTVVAGRALGASGGAPAVRTGDARVDAVLASLDAVADSPPAEQVGPLTEAHRVLRETLDTIGDA